MEYWSIKVVIDRLILILPLNISKRVIIQVSFLSSIFYDTKKLKLIPLQNEYIEVQFFMGWKILLPKEHSRLMLPISDKQVF